MRPAMVKKWIDRKHATTFHLVHRSQRDPLINDPEASDRVFAELPAVQPGEGALRAAHPGEEDVRTAGGAPPRPTPSPDEAARHGVYFDDADYDYMQHLREVGRSTDAVLLEAKKPPPPPQTRADLLLPPDVLPSKEMLPPDYRRQQNVPDDIAGLKPDMDLDLREVLEVLEYDDAETRDTLFDDDDDDAADAFFGLLVNRSGEDARQGDARQERLPSTADVRQQKLSNKTASDRGKAAAGAIRFGKASSRSAATRSCGSMSSSVLHRTDGLTSLDAHFEAIQEEYATDDESDGPESSKRATLKLDDSLFVEMMDEFLTRNEIVGKKCVQKDKNSTPFSDLDALRKGLAGTKI